jgi:hypothetical protein
MMTALTQAVLERIDPSQIGHEFWLPVVQSSTSGDWDTMVAFAIRGPSEAVIVSARAGSNSEGLFRVHPEL